MKRLSIVIANYNYERFVADAIDSALALDWPDVEVVVVDDGSTDRSLDVINRYSDQVTILATENAGQRMAANRGFAHTTGDMVIFLDSDDVLPSDLPRCVDEVCAPSVSKVQFKMQRINEFGVPVGASFPAYDPVPSPVDIRYWAAKTTAYPTPPGSGNAYSRTFLEQIMPVGGEVGDFCDSALLAAAPFFGDVVALDSVVVGYRQHGGNDSDLLRDVTRFPREVARARARWRFARGAVGVGVVDERPLFRSRELLQLRVASYKLVPDANPLPGDGGLRLALDAVTSPARPGPEPWLRRAAILCWCVATLAAPPAVARKLVALRYRQDR